MASSVVSSMVLFLLLLLVFPHIDKALGAQEEAQKQSGQETYHPDGIRIPLPPGIHIPGFPRGRPYPKVGPIRLPPCTRANFPRCQLPKGRKQKPPPPPPKRFFEGAYEPGH